MAGKIQTEPTIVTLNQKFQSMRESALRQGKSDPRIWDEYVIVGIDPGETTGFGYRMHWSDELNKIHLSQLATKTVEEGWHAIDAAWPKTKWKTICLIEDYKVYSWKADDHSWANLHTAQFIGALRIYCMQKGIPVVFQMAAEAKTFVTDDMLKHWGVYEAGMKHARDAERHILRYLMFGKVPLDTKKPS